MQKSCHIHQAEDAGHDNISTYSGSIDQVKCTNCLQPDCLGAFYWLATSSSQLLPVRSPLAVGWISRFIDSDKKLACMPQSETQRHSKLAIQKSRYQFKISAL